MQAFRSLPALLFYLFFASLASLSISDGDGNVESVVHTVHYIKCTYCSIKAWDGSRINGASYLSCVKIADRRA